jgi:hypothetical protein
VVKLLRKNLDILDHLLEASSICLDIPLEKKQKLKWQRKEEFVDCTTFSSSLLEPKMARLEQVPRAIGVVTASFKSGEEGGEDGGRQVVGVHHLHALISLGENAIVDVHAGFYMQTTDGASSGDPGRGGGRYGSRSGGGGGGGGESSSGWADESSRGWMDESSKGRMERTTTLYNWYNYSRTLCIKC